MANSERIDTHAHFLPNFYRTALVESGNEKPDGMPVIPPWDPQSHLDFMKSQGISKSYLSISSPGVHFGDDYAAKKLARECNTYAASLAKQHPGKFGSFACLPLPGVNEALEEIGYALDELHADGFVLLTNYHGIYLGDERFERVFSELDSRHAKVFFHPTTGCSCINSQSQKFTPLPYPSPVMEFFFDTARAVVNLILTGTVSRYPNITYLIPHCGAVLPPLIDRFSNFATRILAHDMDLTGEDIDHIFRERFYYDLAGFAMKDQIHGILRRTGPERLLYGSDYPYTPASGIAFQAKTMDQEIKKLFDEKLIGEIYAGNAQALFK
jgi:6-methylsalicylate decarboxylase